MNSYTKRYNFGYLSTDDRLKGNDKLYLRRQSDQIAIFGRTERRLEDNWSMRTTALTLTSTAATLSD